MSKAKSLTLEKVETMPVALVNGVLYVSEKYKTALHLCCCGCGSKVVTPIKPGRWSLTITSQGKATLYPSIGNWSFPCQSHYWIRKGNVEWAPKLSQERIEEVRIADQQELEARLSVENPPEGLWQMIKRKVAKLLGL